MKKYLLKISLIAILGFTVSCDDYLDVNQDPDVIGDTDIYSPSVILPTAQMSIANSMMGWDFGIGAGFLSQYYTQNYTASQFKTVCEFEQIKMADAYDEFMSGGMMDLEKIKQLSTAESDKGYYYIAEALSIFGYQILTDVWGEVPYSEALKGADNMHPKFDKGEDIYADLVTRVDALLAMDVSSATINGSADFIYGGNMANWKQFVNSLKLKLMIRLSETPGYDNTAVLSHITNSQLSPVAAMIASTTFDNTQEGKRHPFNEFEEGGANYMETNVIACLTFSKYLSLNSDPRIDSFFKLPEGETTHKGAFFGDFDSTEDTDLNGTDDGLEEFSKVKVSADMDLVLMSVSEIHFYVAEVYARANNEAKAKEHYDIAVTASLTYNGVASTDIITTGYAAWNNTGVIESNVKQIAMQKWVSYANTQHIESFIERNRTHYPAMNNLDIEANRNDAYLNFPTGDFTVSVVGKKVVDTEGEFASPFYPESLMNLNNNAPSQKATIGEKVWWNQK